MFVPIALVAASFVVWYLVGVLRADARSFQSATSEDVESIIAELASVRQRLENLEAIAAAESSIAETSMLDIERKSDELVADATRSKATSQRLGQ